jgi:phage terminase Nu1 subunit (DNA packaging protein)
MTIERSNSDRGRVLPFPGRPDREPWVTKQQLARHFDVSPKTVERWTADGMPCLRPAGRRTIRYRISECENWLAAAA